MSFNRGRFLTFVFFISSLIACGSRVWARAAAAPTPAPAPTPEAPPVEAYRFSVNPKLNDEVVGEVQITHAAEQDTLADRGNRLHGTWRGLAARIAA